MNYNTNNFINHLRNSSDFIDENNEWILVKRNVSHKDEKYKRWYVVFFKYEGYKDFCDLPHNSFGELQGIIERNGLRHYMKLENDEKFKSIPERFHLHLVEDLRYFLEVRTSEFFERYRDIN